jgi:hypothetical protein
MLAFSYLINHYNIAEYNYILPAGDNRIGIILLPGNKIFHDDHPFLEQKIKIKTYLTKSTFGVCND